MAGPEPADVVERHPTASLPKLIAVLAYPVALSRLFQALVGIIDIAMVGGLGAAATAAVGTGRQLVFISEMMMLSIISGAMAVTAQVTGQEGGYRATTVLRHAFILLLVVSLVLGALGYLATPLLLRLVGAQGEVFSLGVDYMHIFFAGLWAMALSHIISNIMQASGDTLTPFFIIAAINVMHVIGNYIFINGFGDIPAMGVRGAALGQVSSRFFGLLLGLGIVYSGVYRINMRQERSLAIDWQLVRRIFRIGIPVTVQGLSRNGASIVLLRIIASAPAATIGLAAFAIGTRLSQFAFFGANAFSTVSLILVGQSLGAGESSQAEQRGWVTLRFSLVLMTLIGLVFLVFAQPLVDFFTDDPAVIAAGVQFVRMLAIAQPFIALMQAVSGALQGAGDTRPPLYYTLIAQWLIAIPLAYVLTFPLGLGMAGVWIAVVVSPMVQGVLVVNKFRSGSWKQHYARAQGVSQSIEELYMSTNHDPYELREMIAAEANGEQVVRYIEEIIHYNRALGSRDYHQAAEYMLRTMEDAGLETDVVEAPLDNGPVPYNWPSPYAWELNDAVFKILEPEERTLVTMAQDTPMCVHSWSAATPAEGATAELVYVGDGTRDEDYVGKDVQGKIVFADKGANWLVYRLAVEKYGALGYVSDDILEVPPLKTRERFPDMVLWYTFYERGSDGGPLKGWGFSISPRQGDYLRGLLEDGPVVAHALVDSRTFEGVMENPVGTIRGSEHPEEEVLLMAHLCHPNPGATDNGSGLGVLLEAARLINRLIESGKIERPRRSIKFLFGPEGHVSNVYPSQKGQDLHNILASITVDTVGCEPSLVGGPHLFCRTSAAVPSYVNDLGVRLLKAVTPEYSRHSDDKKADQPVDASATSPFKFEVIPWGLYSDNSCISGWGVPAVGLLQWPSIFWHTPYDTPEKLSPRILHRLVRWVAETALAISNAGSVETVDIMHTVGEASERRLEKVATRARATLQAAGEAEREEALARAVDELAYNFERDSQAIASAKVLVRHEDEGVQRMVGETADRLVERLEAHRRRAERDLQQFESLVRR